MPWIMRRINLFLHLVFLLAGSGPALAGSAPGQEVHFVATIAPLAAILREVTGDRAMVTTLLPPGASPHTFQPKPSQAKILEKALAFFLAGPNLDKEWAGRLPARRQIEMVLLLPAELRLAAQDDHDHDHGKTDDHGATALDSHFWTDPLAVRAMIPELVSKLGGLDPQGRELYQSNGRRFSDELTALDQELTRLLQPVKTQPFFLFHPSFQYLFKRYQLRLAGLIEPFPGREPSPKFLRDLTDRIKNTGATAVFSEVELPVRPAEVLAEAAGVRLCQLNPLGGTPGLLRYADLMRHNARILGSTMAK